MHKLLTNRRQRIIINGDNFNESTVRSGVPADAVLGTLLFLIMIGDINADIKHSRVTTFAINTRISTLSLIEGEDKCG